MSEHALDVRGLLCPMPVIRTQDKVEKLAAGDILKVCCTDPGAIHDIPAWCRVNGHEMLEIDQQEEQIFITIQVGEA